ncbi:MAG: ABC transporter permease [Acidobacteriota bacterium]|nr:ABC transporter permease [Acidobacteriota bacterium]
MISENAGVNPSGLTNIAPSMPEGFHSTISLPEEPLIKIRPSRPWSLIDLRDLWSHRELFAFLVWRDLKVRYKQTILGGMWVILQPLLMTLVFTIFLGKLVRVETGTTPYPLFLYAGLLPWTFFSNAVSSGSFSLLASSQMITRVYLPRLILPAAAVTVRLSDFLIASVVLIILMLYYGIPLGWQILLLPALILELALLALALSALLSALNVKYRDTGTALPVMLQIWMFASPIVYPRTLVPARWEWAYQINPLTGMIEGFRSAFLGLPINRQGLALSLLITVALLVFSMFVFRRLEDEFADIV